MRGRTWPWLQGSMCPGQVHKHSGMGCAVVSLSAAETREAIMCYAEKTYGRSAAGKLEMDIADVKVQLCLGLEVVDKKLEQKSWS